MNKKYLWILIAILVLCFCCVSVIIVSVFIYNTNQSKLLEVSQQINQSTYADFCTKADRMTASEFELFFSKRYRKFKDLQEFNSKELDGIYDSEHGCLYKLPTSIDELKNLKKDFDRDISPKNFYILSGTNSEGTISIYFVHEDDHWKIDHISLFAVIYVD